MIGIAFTGSGKTVAFSLPMIMLALQSETTKPLVRGEGPCGMVLCPSRELARQTFDVVVHFCEFLAKDGWPQLATLLAIGGTPANSTNPNYANNPNKVSTSANRPRAFRMAATWWWPRQVVYWTC